MNFANSTVSQKQSNAERLMRCIIYSPHWLRMCLAFVGREGRLYTYTGVGLSALLVSTYRAMRRPIDRGTSDRRTPRLRMYQRIVLSALELVGLFLTRNEYGPKVFIISAKATASQYCIQRASGNRHEKAEWQ